MEGPVTMTDILREGLALATLFLVLILWSVVGHAMIG
jgi:hypothetical protein